jgi:hypothetical protein
LVDALLNKRVVVGVIAIHAASLRRSIAQQKEWLALT